MDEIPVLLIGVGGFGYGRVKMVHETPGFRVAAICDIDGDVLERVGEEFGVPRAQRFLDSASACQRADAELVVIITLPGNHAEHIGQAFDGRKHVLCSKPLCDTVSDARRIRELCRAHPDLCFMVDQNARWNESVDAIKGALFSDLIGRLGYITWTFEMAFRFGGWREEMPEVLLADMAVHHFDLVRHLTGLDATEVFSRSFNPSWSWFEGNPCASAVFQMERGVQLNYFGSWVTRGRADWASAVRIVGERGAIHWSADQAPVAVFGAPEGDGEEPREEPLEIVPFEHEQFLFSLHEIAAAMREGRDPAQCTIDDNLRTMAMVIGARESSRTNQPVRMDALGLY